MNSFGEDISVPLNEIREAATRRENPARAGIGLEQSAIDVLAVEWDAGGRAGKPFSGRWEPMLQAGYLEDRGGGILIATPEGDARVLIALGAHKTANVRLNTGNLEDPSFFDTLGDVGGEFVDDVIDIGKTVVKGASWALVLGVGLALYFLVLKNK